MKKIFTLFATVLLSAVSYAQSLDSSTYIHRPFQVSFITPMGTNGMESGKVVNNLSLNILGGYHAGLEGAEFGSIFNIEKDYVQGVQFGGVFNLVGRKVNGAQFAGVFNLNGGYTQGAQFAGVMNIVADSVMAHQFAGILNANSGSTKGSQFAGVLNFSTRTAGPQVAGVLNVSAGELKGAQIAGVANITTAEVKGVQISGVLNVATKVTGSQIGFLNIADTVTGIPFGFMSIVRKGYHHPEVFATEHFPINVAMKLGVKQFYNIFAGAIQPAADKVRWGYGYGIGSEWKLVNSLNMNFDAMAYHVNEDITDFTEQLNILGTGKLNVSYSFKKHFSVFAGPTYNVMVSELYDAENNFYGSAIAPKKLLSFNTYNNDISLKMWLGFNAGIRL